MAELGFDAYAWTPPAHLRPFVQEGYGYTERSAGPLRRIEFPRAAIAMIIQLGPPITLLNEGASPASFVVGLHEVASVTEHGGFQQGLQLNLTLLGARALLGHSMDAIAGRVVEFSALVPGEDWSARLSAVAPAGSGLWRARFALLEALLSERLSQRNAFVGPSVPSQVVSHAVAKIERSGGNLDVARLCQELGYSQKHTIAMFKTQVGVSPKRLCGLVRFERILEHLRSGKAPVWGRLAQELGYADQAHLARSVRRFAGCTPTELLGYHQVNFVQDLGPALAQNPPQHERNNS